MKITIKDEDVDKIIENKVNDLYHITALAIGEVF